VPWDKLMRERSVLQSVFALGLRHLALAVLIAVAIATALFFWAGHLPVKYTASALLSVDSPASRASVAAPAPTTSALAAAETILRSDQFAVLVKRLHLDLAPGSATSHSHPQISLTQPSPVTLRVTVAGSERKAVTVAANAVASLLAAWVPLQPPAPAPIPAPPPPVAVAAQPLPPKQPTPESQPDDLAQLRSELASRQAILEVQFDRLNRRLNTLAAQRQKFVQNASPADTASSAKLAAIAKQESQFRTTRAQLLRQLEANDTTSDALRARAAAAARQARKVSPESTTGSVSPSSIIHKTPPPSVPASPPSPTIPQQTTPETEAANVSFTVAALASQAQPIADKRKSLLEWSGAAAGLVIGMLYLIFAMWLYRPVAGAATLEDLLPAQVTFLGAIPAPPAIPTRSAL